VSASTLAREHGADAARAQYRAMRDSVHEVAEVCDREHLDADVAAGGTIVLARSEAQLQRARTELAESDQFDLGLHWLQATEARRRVAATSVLGATYTPDCLAINPAKLVRGLADLVEQRGVQLYETTTARAIEPGVVHTDRGVLRADVVIRATEGYTPRLAGLARTVAPVYSLMIATAPLPPEVWNQIGLRRRETWSDHRHLIIYGQRTADDRMAFGGRGAPYHFGSRIDESYDQEPTVFEALRKTLGELFPVLAGVEVTHRWGGPLGVTRDWHASVGLDHTTGLGWAGGYVGDGVATTNLAGRTLADLITRTESERTSLPWVGHRSPVWEPEPLRWLGANAALRAMTWADTAEQRHSRPSRLAWAVDHVLGR
jgi:glycine/D-amino acid oxidase-like deaminating enzyme